MTDITPDERTYRPREWRDSDQTTRTDDESIIATLRAQLARAETFIQDVQRENRQLREALTQCQERES